MTKLRNQFINKKTQSGLTMIELVLVIVIMGIIGTALSHFLINSVRAYTTTEKNITALTKMRLVNTRLDYELREVNYIGDPTFEFDVSTFTNTNFVFNNKDGATSIQIIYDGVANNLALNYDGSGTILSDNITTFTLNYYQGDGITNAAAVDEIIFVEYAYDITEDNITYSSTARIMLRDGQ